MLPNFLIIGAMKSGTTTLYHALKKHPEIFMPNTKEPQFFSDEKKIKSFLPQYESLFSAVNNEKAIGEASTNYTKFPALDGVPERIKTHIPNAKLIYIIRNPIDRIYSQYTHNYYLGKVENNLSKALVENKNYINSSKYYMQIQEYLRVFSEDQIKVVFLDDLRDTPGDFIKDIYRFLGVSSEFVPPDVREHKHQTINKAGHRRSALNALRKLPFYNKISNHLSENIKGRLNLFFRKRVELPKKMTDLNRRYIIDHLQEDIYSLQEYLRRDLSVWMKVKPNVDAITSK